VLVGGLRAWQGDRNNTEEVRQGMSRLMLLLAALAAISLAVVAPAYADGPSGSTECHINDDDCDGVIDEDTGAAADDNDGDGAIDEDSSGDTNGDGNPDDDGDGRVDEDPADDDGDGSSNEDAPGDALDDPGENQVDCNEQTSQDVGGQAYLYAGSNGVEVCADDTSQAAVDGHATATTDDGGYVTVDGDNTNPAPANGYVRFDDSGVHCGDETNQDSSADQTNNTSADCG
jgi:hypothetical protein